MFGLRFTPAHLTATTQRGRCLLLKGRLLVIEPIWAGVSGSTGESTSAMTQAVLCVGRMLIFSSGKRQWAGSILKPMALQGDLYG